MSKADLPLPLRGIIPPLVTPLSAADQIDRDGLERLIEHVIGGGVHGVFVLGTTGEAPSLSYRLRHELIGLACRHVAGRVPVLVGVTDTSRVETLRLAQWAAEAGAQAVVMSTPYYFPAGQQELRAYFENIAADLPLPVVLYNMPSHTKLTLEPETVEHLLSVPKFVGLKDSSGQMIYWHRLREIVAARPDFSLLIGPEQLLAESLLLGGQGGICAGANLAPSLFVDLYQAAVRVDLPRVAELQSRVMRLSSAVYHLDAQCSALIKGLKCALACLGICDDFVASPFQRFGGHVRQQMEQHLNDLDLKPAMPASIKAGRV